jgi:hypothetical protein
VEINIESTRSDVESDYFVSRISVLIRRFFGFFAGKKALRFFYLRCEANVAILRAAKKFFAGFDNVSAGHFQPPGIWRTANQSSTAWETASVVVAVDLDFHQPKPDPVRFGGSAHRLMVTALC